MVALTIRRNTGAWRQSLELIYLLVLKELKVRYKSSLLGYLWAVANPFAFAFVYWLAFKFIMRVQMENYSIFLITGMFPWIWLSAGVTQATKSYQANVSLVKKVNLDRAIIPLSSIVQEMVHFLFALPAVAIFLVALGDSRVPLSWIWQVPVMMAVQLAFAYPIALTLALVNVFVRDVEYLIGIVFSLLFFATPIVYSISMVPPNFQVYFRHSPLHHLIDAWRSILLHGTMNFHGVAVILVWSAAFGLVAAYTYRRLASRIGELL
jgi:lipopolysaccharide transport system permease protein